jgi:hypothetical protein
MRSDVDGSFLLCQQLKDARFASFSQEFLNELPIAPALFDFYASFSTAM